MNCKTVPKAPPRIKIRIMPLNNFFWNINENPFVILFFSFVSTSFTTIHFIIIIFTNPIISDIKLLGTKICVFFVNSQLVLLFIYSYIHCIIITYGFNKYLSKVCSFFYNFSIYNNILLSLLIIIINVLNGIFSHFSLRDTTVYHKHQICMHSHPRIFFIFVTSFLTGCFPLAPFSHSFH